MVSVKPVEGMNPFLPGKTYVPDGEPHVFDGRVYLYGSHDRFNGTGYCQEPYVAWSAPVEDLTDWRYEGVILPKGQDPLDPDGTKSYYAPDVARGPDGRYYLYYSLEDSSVISVAVSDTPAGRYAFYGHVRDRSGHVLGSAEGDAFQFDPAVLTDEDGKIYLYSGQSFPLEEANGRKIMGSQVCQLAPDMVTAITPQEVITSRTENCFQENPFFEASSIRKFGGRYYFIYSALPNTHLLCYAVSDHPDRDFRYQGVLISNGDVEEDGSVHNYWGNNHGSIAEIVGQYYIFYHRHTNKSGWCRQACAEPLRRNPDGTLRQARMTSSGLHGDALPAKGRFACASACHLTKKGMEPFRPFTFLTFSEEDPFITQEEATEYPFIANLRDGASAGYRYFRFDGTEKTFLLTCRGTGTGKVVVTDPESRDTLACLAVTPAPQWREVRGSWQGAAGRRGFQIRFEGEGALDHRRLHAPGRGPLSGGLLPQDLPGAERAEGAAVHDRLRPVRSPAQRPQGGRAGPNPRQHQLRCAAAVPDLRCERSAAGGGERMDHRPGGRLVPRQPGRF